jgi:drug/metabolite transporter (DMT)-like permease
VGLLHSALLNGIVVAIVAHALIGASLVWDKVLLQRKGTQNLVAYVFWLGAISVFGLLLIPFGFRMPPWRIAGVAFLAGAADMAASYFYYAALKAGEASDELAAMGGFAPVATALLSVPFLRSPLGGQFLGFALMTAGGFLMFFAEKKPLRQMLPGILAASFCFGLTNVLQKIAFNRAGFISGYVLFTIGTTAGSLALLIPPSWRRQIFEESEEAPPASRFWYMVNRFSAGVGSFLVVFAVSRTRPALVEAISGLRYVVIFAGAFAITRWKPAWFREDFSRRVLVAKAVATSLILAGLILVGMSGGNTAAGPT